jgi:DNA-directed RNA polymerase specialized sigma24 family protein
MVKNAVARRFRAQRPGETELAADTVTSAAPPPAALNRKELTHQIQQALISLARSRRVALELSQEGLSAKQIASVVNCTENAARRRVQKAKQDLIRILSHCGDSCALDQRRPEQCPAQEEDFSCLKYLFLRKLRAHGQRS